MRLTTIRSHDQYNTTIYSLNDRYRSVFGGRKVVFMNPDDMAERHIEPEALVDVDSPGLDPNRSDKSPHGCLSVSALERPVCAPR